MLNFLSSKTAPDSLSLCVWGEGKQLAGRGWSAAAGSGGGADSTQGDRIWSSLGRQKARCGLLLIIHIP
jgi:hypothetical protein